MTVLYNDVLQKLTKEQLIEIIKQYRHTTDMISILLVDESKLHISKEDCIEKIRNYMKEFDYELFNIMKEDK